MPAGQRRVRPLQRRFRPGRASEDRPVNVARESSNYADYLDCRDGWRLMIVLLLTLVAAIEIDWRYRPVSAACYQRVNNRIIYDDVDQNRPIREAACWFTREAFSKPFMSLQLYGAVPRHRLFGPFHRADCGPDGRGSTTNSAARPSVGTPNGTTS
jgi:hypothetical protein